MFTARKFFEVSPDAAGNYPNFKVTSNELAQK